MSKEDRCDWAFFLIFPFLISNKSFYCSTFNINIIFVKRLNFVFKHVFNINLAPMLLSDNHIYSKETKIIRSEN